MKVTKIRQAKRRVAIRLTLVSKYFWIGAVLGFAAGCLVLAGSGLI